MASSEQGGTGEHVLLEVLIAQLHRNGMLSADDLDTMKRRLAEAGNERASDNLTSIILSDMIDDPERRRASIHSIGGGKSED